jgi:elongation factor Ts
MTISAKMVMELRQKTQVSMMECKKALVSANGDMALAEENLLKSGAAKAAKKSDRVANEGAIFVADNAAHTASAMVELNCETDFVARGDDFKAFGERLAELALHHGVHDVEALSNMAYNDEHSVESMRNVLVAKLGENIQIRRAIALTTDTGCVMSYSHGGRIASLVKSHSHQQDAIKDIAMHVAAMKPSAITAAGIPAALVDKQQEIFMAQVMESGKPEAIASRIVEGKMQKFVDENALMGQAFVKEAKQKVADYLQAHQADVQSYVLYEIGMADDLGEITQ